MYEAHFGLEQRPFGETALATAYVPLPSRDAALRRMHVRMADGSLRDGAAAFAAIWRALPGWRWLGRVAAWPGIAQGLELGYRGFLGTRRLWRR